VTRRPDFPRPRRPYPSHPRRLRPRSPARGCALGPLLGAASLGSPIGAEFRARAWGLRPGTPLGAAPRSRSRGCAPGPLPGAESSGSPLGATPLGPPLGTEPRPPPGSPPRACAPGLFSGIVRGTALGAPFRDRARGSSLGPPPGVAPLGPPLGVALRVPHSGLRLWSFARGLGPERLLGRWAVPVAGPVRGARPGVPAGNSLRRSCSCCPYGRPGASLGFRAGALPVAATWGVPGFDPAPRSDVAPPARIVRREGTRHG
jgi:hypothetical protein